MEKSVFYLCFMQNIRDFRKRKNLTQQALAEVLGLAAASAICDIEKNKSNLTYSQIEKLLNMGATLTELFGTEFGYSPNNPPPKASQNVKNFLGTGNLLGTVETMIDAKFKKEIDKLKNIETIDPSKGLGNNIKENDHDNELNGKEEITLTADEFNDIMGMVDSSLETSRKNGKMLEDSLKMIESYKAKLEDYKAKEKN